MKKKRLWWLVIPGVLVLLAALFFLGPRADSSPEIPRVTVPADVDAYIRNSEARYSDIVDCTAKTVEWAGTPGTRSDVSIVYLHGFSGSRAEMEPAPGLVAEELDANIFYTRYTGHGRGADPMGDATLQDWVNDTAEALAIGRAIGDYVVVIAVSTAAPLVAWLDTMGDAPDATVFVSPNFGPADSSAGLLLWPWGRLLARIVIGEYNEFETVSERHGRCTTPRFPSSALVTMMAAVNLGREADLESISTPLLCLFSEQDEVVSIPELKAAYARVGSQTKLLREIVSAESHVLAGEIFNPQADEEFVDAVVEFVDSVQ